MAYNYDESAIITEMFDLYDKDEREKSIAEIYSHLKEIVYNLIIYNDGDNILGLINDYGGVEEINVIYFTKYKDSNLLDVDKSNQLRDYNLIAFVGLFDYIYTTVIGVIEEFESETSLENLCDMMSNL